MKYQLPLPREGYEKGTNQEYCIKCGCFHNIILLK